MEVLLIRSSPIVQREIRVRKRSGHGYLLPRRARGHGMEFWASMRMNDIHDDYPECAAYHGSYRKAHPELLLGSPYPEPRHRGNWRSGFCWGLDYARPEVRARQLALIEDVLTRHDVDGFELDFLRGAYYFRTDERRTGMPLMTGFVRDVRALVDRAGEGKGRPLTLAIRVGRDVDECESAGIDVRTWAAEGLADRLIPMWAGRMDTEADVAGMVALTRAAERSGTLVAGGLVGSVYGYGILPDTTPACGATPPLRVRTRGRRRRCGGSRAGSRRTCCAWAGTS